MRQIRSAINRESETYRSNYAANLTAAGRLREELRQSTLGGGGQYVRRHLARGRLLPRERVEMLLERVWAVETAADMRPLVKLMAKSS